MTKKKDSFRAREKIMKNNRPAPQQPSELPARRSEAGEVSLRQIRQNSEIAPCRTRFKKRARIEAHRYPPL